MIPLLLWTFKDFLSQSFDETKETPAKESKTA
jgi:hypothetical protein